ncbi:MAG TPA: M23 family metallopeptidase [Bryobacteraceae bacterium]|nr:M23 family metallopeptidase [Bryobacteraceae bacterium]
MKFILLAVVALLIIATPLTVVVLSNETTLKVDPAPKVIGYQTPLHIHAENSHGVRTLTVTVEQDGKAWEKRVAQARAQQLFPERHVPPTDITTMVGRQFTPSLHDGKARIVVTAVSNDFRGKTNSVAFDVDVMTTPPRVVADGAQHYINQGGSEMVTFTPSGAWTEAGVKVGDYTFRSFPLPNHPGQYFSLFAFFWQLPADTPVYVYASNPSGATAKAGFTYKVFPKQFRKSTIALETMNLDRMVNQIDPEHKIPGDLVERFVYINREMRKSNNKTLADLRFQSEPKFLWTGAFLPMVDSTVESRFADDRTYTWQGKKVDEQTHLGFDLAKVAHSPIPASNDGRVLFAENLGIYGNCVVIDHGFGLQTIYGHLSEFAVKKGDMVKKGQIIGKTGSTGLAGGDHLHFTMQVDGVQVNAVEWWDPHWVKDRILSKMGESMPESEDVKGGYPTPARKVHAKKRRR